MNLSFNCEFLANVLAPSASSSTVLCAIGTNTSTDTSTAANVITIVVLLYK